MKTKIIRIVISLFLFILGISFEHTIQSTYYFMEYVDITIYVIAYLISSYDVLYKAFRNILKGQIFDENFLMSIASIGALGIQQYSEAVAVMLFYQVGEVFQSYAINKSRKSISALMDIRPEFANILINGELKRVDPYDVRIDDVIEINPGERVPLDGIIIEGKTNVDSSSLTGESLPSYLEEGKEILSGSINLTNKIRVKVLKEYGESTVSKILDLVENATDKKAKSENFITKFAAVYTPIVVFAALALFLLPPIIMQDNSWLDRLNRALSFLVVSCPCAFVISVPLSYFGGIGAFSKIGVLVKGSNYLEALANVDTLVFDKTGTITKGKFEVTELKIFGIKEDLFKEYVCAAESSSNHPLANSISSYFDFEFEQKELASFEDIGGKGIKAIYKENTILIGNEKLLDDYNISFEKIHSFGTIMYVIVNNSCVGYILLRDTIKENSKKAIQQFKKQGIKNLVMLTGDKKENSDFISKEVGITKCYSNLLPQDKVEILDKIVKDNNGRVGFIGDGINDAPSIARADVGIAMGGLGSDAAIEASDITVMNDDLLSLSKGISIAHKTKRIVYENIAFALVIKIVALVLVGLNIANMWEAVFADVGVTVIAILNALRALHINFKQFNK